MSLAYSQKVKRSLRELDQRDNRSLDHAWARRPSEDSEFLYEEMGILETA